MKSLLKFLICVSLCLPTLAWAVRLGDVKLESNFNQPLHGEIKITDTQGLMPRDVQVRLASEDAFQRLEMERPLFLNDLQFNVVNKGENLVIDVTTANALGQPVIDFLLDFRWPDGRLLRRYTLLLDLPTTPPEKAAPKAKPATKKLPAKKKSAHKAHIATHTASVDAPKRYGPTSKRDQLLYIARKLRPANDVTIAQTALAIYHSNPQAFEDFSIHKLKRGVYLDAPSAAAVRAIDAQDADQQIWGSPGRIVPHKRAPRVRVGSVIAKSGDNLLLIAERVRPDKSVSVEQTAWGLFKLNHDGFIGGNINGLHEGQVLRVPSLRALKFITHKEAEKNIANQNQAWQRQHPEFYAAEQAATEQTDSAVTQHVAAAAKPAALPAKPKQTANPTVSTSSVAQNKPVAPAPKPVQAPAPHKSDHFKPDMALHETLQRSLAKPENMSQGAISPAKPAMSATAEQTMATKPDVAQPIAEKPEPTPAEQAELEHNKPESLPENQLVQFDESKPPAPPISYDEPDVLLTLLPHDWYSIGGGVVALLALAGGLFWWRQRRLDIQLDGELEKEGLFQRYLALKAHEKEVAAESKDDDSIVPEIIESQTPKEEPTATQTETSETPAQSATTAKVTVSNVSVKPAPKTPEPEPTASAPEQESDEPAVDPLEEARVFMAYERYAQAEANLLAALDKQPERTDLKLALLEVYVANAQPEQFANWEALLPDDLQTADSEAWETFQSLKQRLAGEEIVAAPVTEAIEETDPEDDVVVSDVVIDDADMLIPTTATDAASASDSDETLGSTIETTTDSFAERLGQGETSQVDKDDELDAVLGEQVEDEAPQDTGQDNSLDFETGLGNDLKPEKHSLDMSAQDLPADAELSTEAATSTDTSPDNGSSGISMDLDAQLDLAQAYIEIGDGEGAVDILQGLLDKGDSAQQQRAKALLEQARGA